MTVNHDVTGSSPVWGAIFLEGFPSGQRERTVNPSAPPSKVRILPLPVVDAHLMMCVFFVSLTLKSIKMQ